MPGCVRALRDGGVVGRVKKKVVPGLGGEVICGDRLLFLPGLIYLLLRGVTARYTKKHVSYYHTVVYTASVVASDLTNNNFVRLDLCVAESVLYYMSHGRNRDYI